MLERTDTARLNGSMQATLAEKGMRFVTPAPGSFRDASRATSVYADWKQKFGPEGWAALEGSVGALA